MVEPVSFGLGKSGGLARSSSKGNLADMGKQPLSKPDASRSAPALLKRSRSMGTFQPYTGPSTESKSFGKDAVEEIGGKVSIGPVSPAPVPVPEAVAKTTPQTQNTPHTDGRAQPSEKQSYSAPASPTGTSSEPSDAGTASTTPSLPKDTDSPLVDDNSMYHTALARVDYFSHEWNESDLAGSWRYIVNRRQDMANSARLENASWRTWAKAKYNLKTVRPESVNWLKDYDVTWLYGPLYHERSSTPWDQEKEKEDENETPSSKSADTVKSILKKKTVAEIMMEDAPGYTKPNDFNNSGTDDFLRHHNYRHRTSTESEPQMLTRVLNKQYVRSQPDEDRRVHFNARVEQCIALDPEEVNDEPCEQVSDDSESEEDEEECGLFLGIHRQDSIGSLASSHTIAPLPATTLKIPEDSDEEEEARTQHSKSMRTSANYDYGSVYTGKGPAYRIVDPRVRAVEVPKSVASQVDTIQQMSPPQQSKRLVASFGCDQ